MPPNSRKPYKTASSRICNGRDGNDMSKTALALILALLIGFCVFQYALIEGYKEMNTKLLMRPAMGCVRDVIA